MRRRWVRILCAIGIALLALPLAGWMYWQGFELDQQPLASREATVAELPLLAAPAPPRGRLLAVLSSAPRIGDGSRKGGYELTEISRAYYLFQANGFDVDLASPQGGEAPVVIDDDLLDVDFAFLNDRQAQRKARNTLRLSEVDSASYAGVYFVGGKGAMVDFPNNPDIARIIADIDGRGGVIGAVCHGPAALIGVQAQDGSAYLRERRITAFSNAEELFLIKDAQQVFGQLLQDQLIAAGAQYSEAPMYLHNVVVDGRLVTGQNPWSTWGVAEAMIELLGHDPQYRAPTGEEQSVEILAAYHSAGFIAARTLRQQRPQADRRLLLMHALIAAMQGSLADAFQLQRLARS